MRLIGNKTKLLSHIESLLRDRGFATGSLIDIFCGTSCVGRHFKKLGMRVIANDHMSACYSQAVASIEVSRAPKFEKFLHAHRDVVGSAEYRQGFNEMRSPESLLPLSKAVLLLDRFVPPKEGLIYRSYCPGGLHGRKYFQDGHGRKIDGILEILRESSRADLLAHGELHLLLVSLIDAADRVANISGTYGAYLKGWQPNTLGEMRLKVPEVIESPLHHEVHQEDANRLIRNIQGDVLYIDPPYNRRQYAANYHILEILAEHHRIGDLAAYEAALYGKTGLRPYDDLKSVYCVRPGRAEQNVLTAMNDLILSSHARSVVVSYSEEGLLSPEEIGTILARFSRTRSFNFSRDLVEIEYARFRSDSDRTPADGSAGRTYRVVEGKKPHRIGEFLFWAQRPQTSRVGKPAGKGRARSASRVHAAASEDRSGDGTP
jgi:adenine-specific DNA-methyltransferase